MTNTFNCTNYKNYLLESGTPMCNGTNLIKSSGDMNCDKELRDLCCCNTNDRANCLGIPFMSDADKSNFADKCAGACRGGFGNIDGCRKWETLLGQSDTTPHDYMDIGIGATNIFIIVVSSVVVITIILLFVFKIL